MRLKYVLNEALIGLWRNVTMTIAMIITMAVSLVLLGSSVLLYMQAGEMREYYYGEIQVSVFLRDDVTEAQRTAVKSAIESSPLKDTVTYESKADALERFKEMWKDQPDFVNSIGPNALPESFRVKLKDPEQYSTFTAGIQNLQGILEIVDQRQLLDRLFDIFDSIQLGSLIAASLMALAALLLVGNTIQVAAYSKRREVAVMKLVGASNWFIQAPFVLEAVVAGLIGAIIGFCLLFAGKVFLLDDRLAPLVNNVLTPIPNSNVWLMLPLLAAVASAVSAVTAWVMLRFYVKV